MNVQAPDGSVISFPDDTDPAVVGHVMHQNFAGPPAAPAADPKTTPVESGTLIPMTRYADGHVGFDSNAGVFGMAKNIGRSIWGAATLPGDVATGKVDVNDPSVIGRAADLAGLAAPMAPGAKMLSAGREAVAVPTADALHAAATAAYTRANDLGVEYASPAVADMARGVQAHLNDNGVLSVLAPKTHAILNSLTAVPDGVSSVPFGSLEAARKAFGLAGRDFTNPTEQHAAGIAREAIDGFVTNPLPAHVVAGPAGDVARIISEARGNYGAAARSDIINGIEQTAERRTNATYSGNNLGNNLRGRAATLLDNDKQIASFDPGEVAALEGVNRGTFAANAARTISNKLGGGGGLGHGLVMAAGAGLGAHLAGEGGAAAGGAIAAGLGPAFRSLSNGLTSNAMSAVDELVRSRSPLYRDAAANAPTVVNLGQTALNAGARPLSQAFVLNGSNSSLNNAPPGTRQSDLYSVLNGTHPGLGSVFGNLNDAQAAFAPQ